MSVDGLVVDLFAGGGGASTGLAWALGRDPDIAINHDAEALALHAANHPRTRHMQNDITRVLPLEATGGREVAILHASPDCTHFSKAKGGKPRSQHIRDLAWVVIRWAEDTHPVLITLENVEEFQTWGPLDQDGHPIKAQAGQTFRAWTRRLRRLGYQVAWRLLRACDYGAPTTRKRLFVVARCDHGRSAWPRPTHGAPDSPEVQSGKLLPWRTAAECIDWHIQSRSIFDRQKPLARNTQRRIAEGLRRYVFQAVQPFVISYYGAKAGTDFRGQTLHQPLPTQTTENRFGLVSPVVITNTTGHAPKSVDAPLPTVTTGKQQLVAGAIISPNHVAPKYTPFRGQDIKEPLRTITRAPGFALASLRTVPFVQHVQHGSAKHGVMPADEPMRTITAWPKGGGMALVGATLIGAGGPERAGEAAPLYAPARTVMPRDSRAIATACMVKYYGNEQGGVPVSAPLHTITSKDRMGLITATLEGVDERAARTRDWLREWGVIGPTDEPIIGHGAETYRITDICMRMLAPRELYNAQGFPPDYKIDTPYKGKPMSKTAQVRMCGNSVPPVLVCALVQSNGPQTWQANKKPRLGKSGAKVGSRPNKRELSMSKTTSGVKFYPLIFSGDMVWALRLGKKTQTRRPLRQQPVGTVIRLGDNEFRDEENSVFRPPVRPGDIFWGREAWRELPDGRIAYENGGEVYRWCVAPDGRRYYLLEGHLNSYCLCATKGPRFSPDSFPGKWRPSIHMRFEIARIFLRVETIMLTRVQDITEAEAEAEGMDAVCRRDYFAFVWDCLYGASSDNSWDKNPYVWTYTFRPISVEEASKCAIMPQ